MLLHQIIQAVHPLAVEGSLLHEVVGVAYDCRRVRPGTVYVALPRRNGDCHESISVALERGATAVICERGSFLPPRTTKIVVGDSGEALARTAAAFLSYPSRKLRVIGVLGSEQKASVAHMLKRQLEGAGIRAGLISSVNYEIADRMLPVQRLQSEALDVQQLLADMVRAGCQTCVMELGSEPADLERVRGIEFHAVVCARLSPYSFEGDTEAGLEALRRNCPAIGSVIHLDGSFGSRQSGGANASIQVTRNGGQSASLRASILDLNSRGTRISLETARQRFICTIPLWGRGNIYSAIAAAGTALALGVAPTDLRPVLQRTTPAPGRLEAIRAGQPFMVFVDGARDEAALENALVNLREMVPGKLLLAVGSPGGEEVPRRFRLGRTAAANADFTVVTADNPRQEEAAEIAEQIMDGCRSLRANSGDVELDRAKAIERLLRLAEPGDAVLIAGKGHETFQEFADTVVPFDDGAHARRVLEDLGYGKGIKRYELRVASLNQFRAWNAELAACNT